VKTLDRIFGVLLILSAGGHTAGTMLMLPIMSGMWVWSMGGALAAFLLGVLNLVRAGRPQDKTLAVITLAGTACWALLSLAFNKSIGNMLDPRGAGHFVISVVLVCFCTRTLLLGEKAKSGDEPFPVQAL
jgi:hypothetical protein